jgi:hypothetical protein
MVGWTSFFDKPGARPAQPSKQIVEKLMRTDCPACSFCLIFLSLAGRSFKCAGSVSQSPSQFCHIEYKRSIDQKYIGKS